MAPHMSAAAAAVPGYGGARVKRRMPGSKYQYKYATLVVIWIGLLALIVSFAVSTGKDNLHRSAFFAPIAATSAHLDLDPSGKLRIPLHVPAIGSSGKLRIPQLHNETAGALRIYADLKNMVGREVDEGLALVRKCVWFISHSCSVHSIF